MVEADDSLARECVVFARYLADTAPPPSMPAYYISAHARIPYRAGGPPRGVDAALLAAGRLGGPALRAADSYARFLRPTGPLRQKLSLALAILDNSPETHRNVGQATIGSVPAVLAGMVGGGLLFALSLGFGLLLFGPMQLVAGGGAAEPPGRG